MTVSLYPCERPRQFRADLATTLKRAYAYSLIRVITHTTPHGGRRDSALLAIRTPLSPPENYIDQYRYASIRSRHTDSAAMQPPLPVFHVKPWDYQDLSVSGLLTSKTLLEQGRGVVVCRLGVSQQRHLRTQRRSWSGINPASTPRTRSDRWFHVKPRSYSSDAPFSL